MQGVRVGSVRAAAYCLHRSQRFINPAHIRPATSVQRRTCRPAAETTSDFLTAALPASVEAEQRFESVPAALKSLSLLRKWVTTSPLQQVSESEQAQACAILQSWVQAAESVTSDLTPRQTAGVLGALATMYRRGLVAPDSDVSAAVAAYTHNLLQYFNTTLKDFTAEELIYVLTSAALLCPDKLSDTYLDDLEVVLYPLLPQLSGSDLAACMWALSRISGDRGWYPDDTWLEQFLGASLVKLPSLSNADLAAVLSALARFECRPAQPWLDALFVSLKSRTSSMSAGELQLIKYSCLELGVAVEVDAQD